MKKRITSKRSVQSVASLSKRSAKKTPVKASKGKTVEAKLPPRSADTTPPRRGARNDRETPPPRTAAATAPSRPAEEEIAGKKTAASPPNRSPKGSTVVTGDALAARRNGAALRMPNNKAASATSQDPIQFPEEKRLKVKTYLSTKELRDFKEILLAKREELAGDVRHLTSEALNRNAPGAGEQSTMPIHMADLGTDNWEQDFTLGLIASEQAVVREIDEALDRIADKTYGICVATDKPITRERLRAKPWAKYCIEYARLREEGRAP